MNIFALDKDPQIAAEMHCDKHVVKMILEYAQLLSTTHRVLDGDNDALYKKTHVNHPSSIWARESKQNYLWLHELWVCLSNEYTHRYGKVHKSYEKLHDILNQAPGNIEDNGMTPLRLAMPDQYRCEDFVKAYRDYYKGEKQGFAKWTNRSIPAWFK